MPRVIDSSGRIKMIDTTVLTTKGDLSGFDTVANRVPVGASGTLLMADPNAALGLTWTGLNGFPSADPAFGDTLVEYNAAAAADKAATLQKVGGLFLPNLADGRLTLTTATPVTTSDVTAATTLYYTPYNGDRLSVYDGTRWNEVIFAELSINLTASQTGTTHNGTAVIDGLTDTSQLVRGMKVTGTNVGAAAIINSIDSATQVTVSVNSTGSASNTITFKCPSGKNYDVFAVLSGTTAKLQFGNAWGGNTTRADALGDQNGKNNVNNAVINSGDSNSIAAKSGLYLGTVRTTGTDGQTEDSFGGASQAGGHRYVWNCYNRKPRQLGVIDTTNSWTYASATWRSVNGAAGNKVEYIAGLSEEVVEAIAVGYNNPGSATAHSFGIGVDATNANNAQIFSEGAGAQTQQPCAVYRGFPGIGYHAIDWNESARTGTATVYGDNGTTSAQTGLVATVWA